MDYAIVAYAATFVNLHSCIDNSIVANAYPVANISLWINLCIVANYCSLAYISKGSDVNNFTDFCRAVNIAGLFDSCPGWLRSLINLQQLCQCSIGIINANKGCLYRLLRGEAFVDDYNRSICIVEIGFVFWIGQKG